MPLTPNGPHLRVIRCVVFGKDVSHGDIDSNVAVWEDTSILRLFPEISGLGQMTAGHEAPIKRNARLASGIRNGLDRHALENDQELSRVAQRRKLGQCVKVKREQTFNIIFYLINKGLALIVGSTSVHGFISANTKVFYCVAHQWSVGKGKLGSPDSDIVCCVWSGGE